MLEIGRTYKDPRTVEVAGRYRLCHIAHKDDRDRYSIPREDQESQPFSGGDQETHPIAEGDKELHSMSGDDRDRYPLPRAIRIRKAGFPGRKQRILFLKQKIATTPNL